jgi:acetyl esterase
LPTSYVFTAGFDPLRDEAHAYADALDAAGVPVRYVCYESLIHGFMAMTGGVRAARRAVSEIAECLRRELGVGSG